MVVQQYELTRANGDCFTVAAEPSRRALCCAAAEHITALSGDGVPVPPCLVQLYDVDTFEPLEPGDQLPPDVVRFRVQQEGPTNSGTETGRFSNSSTSF